MRALTFQAPGDVRIQERPEPHLVAADDAIVRIEASGVCGSDLHIYHGRVPVEPGFTLGHEFVGTVVDVGDATAVRRGDRVLACFLTACGRCYYCRRGAHHKCVESRVFGHGSGLGSLQGAQAESVLVPHADLCLRRVPDGVSDEAALFAGDVLGTAYHGTVAAGMVAGDTVAVLGLGPVGLCAVMVARAAGAAGVIAVDTVPERLAMAERLGAQAVHLADGDVRAATRAVSDGRGVDICVEAVGDPRALDLAIRVTRNAGILSILGVYAERAEVHLGLAWIKGLTVRTGQANVIAHLDAVLALLTGGAVDPAPLVSRTMSLDDAPEAYRIYDRREALKILLRP